MSTTETHAEIMLLRRLAADPPEEWPADVLRAGRRQDLGGACLFAAILVAAGFIAPHHPLVAVVIGLAGAAFGTASGARATATRWRRLLAPLGLRVRELPTARAFGIAGGAVSVSGSLVIEGRRGDRDVRIVCVPRDATCRITLQAPGTPAIEAICPTTVPRGAVRHLRPGGLRWDDLRRAESGT